MSTGMKFKCASAEHSRVIQEWLFKQGFSWGGSTGQTVEYTDARYLFAYDDGKMLTHDMSEHTFIRKPFVEQVVMTTTKTILVVDSVKPLREKVVVFGKTYYKDDVDAALAKLPIAFQFN
jgi:hypothetical protein